MNIAFQSLFQALVLLTRVLAPGRLAAQSPAAATAQPPRVPELAALIPLATAVSGRLASLERGMADGVDLSRVEQQLRDISARVEEYAAQFLALQASTGPRAGRLPQLKVAIKSAGDALAGVSTFVTDKVRLLGNRRKAWLAEQQRWNAWQAAVLQEEPLEHITTMVTRTQGAIETALGLLRQQLSPLLAIQAQAGTLHTRINTLSAAVEGLLALTPGGIRADASPAMFSALRTLAIVLVFLLLRYLVRGGLEWARRSSVSRHAALLGRHTALVVQRLAWLGDVLIGVVMLAVLLMTWQVYHSPQEAITGLLSVHATIGSHQITIGLVLLTENVLARRHVDPGVSLSVSRLLHYALVSSGFVLALVVLGVDLTKMTLLASALGVGIGFGLQTIANNFVCGLILLLERPLRVGDTIELGGQLAKIAKIGLRSTTVRTADQADVIVPNTELITNQVTNWTLTNRQVRSLIPVGAAYGADIALVMQTLKECALAHPRVLQSPEPQVVFRSFGDSALDFELRAWVADLDTRGQVASDLHQDIDRRFRQAGIVMPFPQRDLHVRSVEHTNTMAAIVRAPPD